MATTSTPPCAPKAIYPCSPYVTINDLFCACDAIDPMVPEDVALFDYYAELSSEELFISTGSKYTGCCETTFVPCRKKCDDDNSIFSDDFWDSWPYPSVPIQVGFTSPPTFVNCWECSCACDVCDCWGGDRLEVPFLPIRDVLSIIIDGVVLPESSYTIVESKWLVRTDGGRWPPLSCGDDDAFKITYRYGWDLPLAGKHLLAKYICEQVKECKGLDCSLSEIYYTKTEVVTKGKMQRYSPDANYLDANLLTGFQPLDRWIMKDRGGMSMFQPTVWPLNPSGRIVE